MSTLKKYDKRVAFVDTSQSYIIFNRLGIVVLDIESIYGYTFTYKTIYCAESI